MGAGVSALSSSRANIDARSLFYMGMANGKLRPGDFVGQLEHCARVEYIDRGMRPAVIHADIALPTDDGAGYVGLTRIGSEMLVIVDNYSLKRPRVELLRDGGLIQFDFRLSGDVALASVGSGVKH